MADDLGTVESRLEALEAKATEADARVAALDEKVQGLIDNLAPLPDAIRGIEAAISDFRARITALEGAPNGQDSATLAELSARVGKVVDIVVKFLGHVGDVYPGAPEDLLELKALDAAATT